MRVVLALVVLLAAGSAAAQPLSFEIKADVPLGQKPQLRIRATEKVTDIRVDLERGDGKKFTARHPSLPRGQAVTLPIGDGAAGKARYQGTLSVQVSGKGGWSHELAFETLVRAPLKVTYDLDHLDLDNRVLQFKLSRPAAEAELVVLGEDGAEIGKGAARYKGESPDTWLPIRWTQRADQRVMMMRLRVVSADGLATRVELIPWSVTVDHEDVNFSTDSAVIEPGEHGKLDASLAKINAIVARSERFMKMKLYIAGHTDTVGAAAKNRKLSLQRAHAIARYFRRKGLKIPIEVAGFGEHVLKVKTPDETDERRNRRADYVLGPAAGAPPFKGAYRKVPAGWKPVP
jgi:outer membrane protein OmpA-like peptidoglycan-associated protein